MMLLTREEWAGLIILIFLIAVVCTVLLLGDEDEID